MEHGTLKDEQNLCGLAMAMAKEGNNSSSSNRIGVQVATQVATAASCFMDGWVALISMKLNAP